ncbi:hypothetical protein SAMN04487886_101028 [Clostridium sp. DSM 8431]|uniref:hypothetical protein n=1 Tax=Clostridium sp. DSM 8431 TaxID=1761781 RepID=UPI0008EECF9E|nr:hypothetical protein [Clostridium sp. DSM 8431]SFU34683.1 hypothetical protein SAMN04487886_101028 [Clostridium sp. DSM 8431]
MIIIIFALLIISIIYEWGKNGWRKKRLNKESLPKNKTNYFMKFLIIILVLSAGYNIHQKNNEKEINARLTQTIKASLQNFASASTCIDDEVSYAKKYAEVVSAKNAYAVLMGNKVVFKEEGNYNLLGLLDKIQHVMSDDKDKFKDVFKESYVCGLMFEISDDFEDREAINEICRLLN